MLTDTDILRAIQALDDKTDTDSFVRSATVVASALESAFTRERWIAADDIVGIMELADFFDVGRSTVTNWAAHRTQNGMPEPVKRLGSGPVYSRLEVVRWWLNWKPVKGAKAGKISNGVDSEGI